MKALYLLFFLIVGVLFLHPINAGDFFHHLNTGRYIIQHWQLPYNDDLSFTAYGKPWVAYAWGSGLLFYVIVQLFGYQGISVLFALLGSLAGVFMFMTLKRLKIETNLALIFTLLACSLISVRWPTRPEVLGPFFVTALLFLLAGKKELSWRLPFFFLTWSIFYGSSVFLGMGILITFIVSQRLFSWKHLGILCACTLLGMLNGCGLRSFLYIFQIPKIASHVGEWLPLTTALNPNLPEVTLFYQIPFLVYSCFTAVSVLLVIGGITTNRKKLFSNYLFYFCLFIAIAAPYNANRFINLSPLVAIPLLAIIANRFSNKIQLFLTIPLIFLSMGAMYARFANFSVGAGLDTGKFKPQVTEFLAHHHINGNIYSVQETGAWISWQLPKSRVFVDTRDDLYVSTDVFNEIALLDQGQVSLLELAKKYGITIFIADLDTGHTYTSLLYSSDWSLVYITDDAFILVRRDIAEKYHLRMYSAIDPIRIPPSKPGQMLQAEKEYEYLIKHSDLSLENYVNLAEIKLALKKPREAKQLVEQVNLGGNFGTNQAMFEISTSELLGRIYTASGDCTKALYYLKNAEKLSKGKLIFSPNTSLPNSVNKNFGEYYAVCAHDNQKAKEYYYLYLNQISNPLEIHHIEDKLEMLNNK